MGVLGVAAVITAGVLSWSLVLASESPQAAGSHPAAAGARARPARTTRAAARYSFRSLDDAAGLASSRPLGINNLGHIVGWLGSGAAGHPRQGFVLRPPYGPARYQNIDVPGAAQTELTGLNDAGVQVGFWSGQTTASPAESDFGFFLRNASFSSVNFPAFDNATPPVNQLLGVNDHDIAVGFYTDSLGHRHGYRYDIATGRFAAVSVPGATSVTAAAINNAGGVAGSFTGRNGVTSGFFIDAAGRPFILNAPGARMTRALGVNDSGEVVGDYRLGSGAGAATHGFTWTRQHGFTTVDDPRGARTTTINGVNNAGDLVGFYVNGAGATEGLLATPIR
jgi:hypothetical protein